MAAHPQQDEKTDGAGQSWLAGPGQPDDQRLTLAPDAAVMTMNPFPSSMSVPGEDGTPVEVELAVLDGVVFAPTVDSLPLAPHVRQYVAQYCAAWSSSVVTTGKLAQHWPAPPRRAQIVFRESQMRAMLGLADDEHLVAVVVDPLSTTVRFVVDSPRLPPKPYWDVEPLVITLPVAAHYEQSAVAQ